MKIDLHTHTRQRSYCSALDEEVLIRCAIQEGLDGLAITDHGRLVPKQILEELNEKYHPFRIFIGVEVTLFARDYQDYIILGIHKPVMASDWTYDILLKYVRDSGGYIYWAHPFRYRDVLPPEHKIHPPDAVEIYSTNIRPDLTSRIKQVAERMGCRTIGASDAHFKEDVGYSYIDLENEVSSDAELVAELKKGAFKVIPPGIDSKQKEKDQRDAKYQADLGDFSNFVKGIKDT